MIFGREEHIPIVFSDCGGMHIEFQPPEGDAVIVAALGTPRRNALRFAADNKRVISAVSKEVRGYYEQHLGDERCFGSGKIVEVLGRPYVLHFESDEDGKIPTEVPQEHAAKVFLLEDVGMISIHLEDANDSHLCESAFQAWADGYAERESRGADSPDEW